MRVLLLTVLLLCTVFLVQSQDFQNETYVSKFEPVSSNGKASITTYFSPDTSLKVETDLIVNAKESIDIAIPGMDSWIYCTDSYQGVYGCTVAKQRTETFPIFQALLNAVNGGIKVRIITNNYYTPGANGSCSDGQIDPLSFLALAGAEVKYFTTVTYLHSKYCNVDGGTSSISSINYSQTSFMKNREAGVIVSGNDDLTDFTNQVFEYDWNHGIPWPTITYTPAEMKIITDKTMIDVVIPSPTSFPGSYVTTVTTVNEAMDTTVFTSPDFAWEQVKADIDASSSMLVYIYQITGPSWCDLLGNYSGSLTILVSDVIFDEADYESAVLCYNHLYNNGITIRKTAKNMYTYSHQKYWVLDNKTVYLSTGNWGETDFPDGSSDFPPSDSSDWRKINRDFNIKMVDPKLTAVYTNLFKADYALGFDYHPYK
ncbi:phospholipase D [Dictyostelium discoideum AX4]|uniref:Mitochondrial cardiolipin hydrolase n=1 Tax=Dictyostelium discoideum TaxID=44689 RepID=Q55CF8_DICDI|nr:phospholipase D [Dictyostelium discoideum AX4]EAL72385.1 phospholipase D [Dictyostelium discoideum AX4]|eukprot:XP_646523.1 phospholipase D [Dictyostelium discoideum AX4]